MKREPIVSGLVSFFLGALIAFSGIACVVTAFNLPLQNPASMYLWGFVFTLAATVFFSFKWGSLVFTALCLLATNILLRTTTLINSIACLIYRITKIYDSGYGWGYLHWPELDAAPLDGGFLVLGCFIAYLIVWTLQRKRPLVFAMLAGIFPLLLCCVLQDTQPHRLPLWLLATGLCLLLLTRSTSRWDEKRAIRLTAWLLIPVMLFNGFLFLWTPTVSYQEPAKNLLSHFYQLITPPASGPGNVPDPTYGDHVSYYSAEDLDLRQVGPRHLGKQRVMLISTEYKGVLYLRAQAYDTYTGSGWEIHADTENEGGWPIPGTSQNAVIRISVYTLSTEKFKYFPYYVNTKGWTLALQNGALQNPDRLKQYSYSMLPPNSTAEYTQLSAQENQLYLSLPEDTRKEAASFLETIFSQGKPESVTEQAVMIREFVKLSAAYDLDTQKMPEGEDDFALWFLRSSETGYCVHFATAAAVLLRAAGIPARYVSGYMDSPSLNRSSTITADQAHAWVEYLDPSRGWTVLEATPPAPEPEVTEPTDPPVTEPPAPTQPPAPTEPSETIPAPTTPPTENTSGATDPVGPVEPARPMDWTWLIVTLQILLVLALLYGQYRLRKWLRRLWLDRGTPNRRAVHRWKYICRFSRLTGQLPPKELYQLTEKAVFSQHTLSDAELLRYDHWIREAHKQLLDKPWYKKLLLRLLLAL